MIDCSKSFTRLIFQIFKSKKGFCNTWRALHWFPLVHACAFLQVPLSRLSSTKRLSFPSKLNLTGTVGAEPVRGRAGAIGADLSSPNDWSKRGRPNSLIKGPDRLTAGPSAIYLSLPHSHSSSKDMTTASPKTAQKANRFVEYRDETAHIRTRIKKALNYSVVLGK